jgi:putative FmdB family regulatory protein
MPIYEFYCDDCNTIFNFFSRKINTTKVPKCPKCHQSDLKRQMSAFSFTGKAKESDVEDDLPFDEKKMEKAMQMLAGEADKVNEDDPKQAADLMRKLTEMTGMELGPGMQEALRRMEAGEDPEKVEAEMGSILEEEDPFISDGQKNKAAKLQKPVPQYDKTLYDL